jgi:RimJ/RimL family protein N-acetyltransferase
MLTNGGTLREVQAHDLAVFFEQQLDPEAGRMAAFPSRDRDTFMAHWTQCLAETTTILRTIVCDGEVAGHVVCWQQEGEHRVGYWLGREHWDKGIVSAALAQFLRLVATRPLTARVAQHNIASLRVLQKCGFAVCGEETFQGIDGEPGSGFIMTLEAGGSE